MNKTAAELLDMKNIPVELVKTKRERFVEGFCDYREYEFGTDAIQLIKVSKVGTRSKAVQIQYVDGQEQKIVIVPPDFLFKMPDDARAQQIIAKYRTWLIPNLSSQLTYYGTIGSDPEIFVEDKDGNVIPAFNFLGSKEKPTIAPYLSHYEINDGKNACYWDGFQGEFTTHPSDCMGWHADSIKNGLQGIYNAMKKHDKTAKLSSKTVFDIATDVMAKTAKEHYAFGCMKSLNAYDMKGIEAPGNEVLYRTAGGHIHFGIAGPYASASLSKDSIVRMVKALDAILGVACVSFFEKYDDPRRREMYGLAGEYRLPPHGLEYRTLSNAWLFHPIAANIVFDLARGALMIGERDLLKYWTVDEKETVRIINECDAPAARKILEANKGMLLQALHPRCPDGKFAYDAIFNGVDSICYDFKDIEKNWMLTGGWKTHCNVVGKTVGNRGKGKV